MTVVLVVAPHPDDEILGCGGTLLRHRASGDEVHWLIMTEMRREEGFDERRLVERRDEIERVAERLGAEVHGCGFPTTRLDAIDRAEVVGAVDEVIDAVAPAVVYLPHPGDAHSDHRVTFEAVAATTKWFRHDSIRAVYACEILSETRFGIDPTGAPFIPTSYVDIAGYLDSKCELMALYAGESGPPPFPRSEDAIRALAVTRGSECGSLAAEAFQLLRERR